MRGGGQQRIINDVAAWIKEHTSLPLTFAEIFTKLEPDKRIIEHATTCCAMLMEAVHAHTVYTDDARKEDWQDRGRRNIGAHSCRARSYYQNGNNLNRLGRRKIVHGGNKNRIR